MADAFIPFFSQMPKPQGSGTNGAKESFVPAAAAPAHSSLPANPASQSGQHRPVVKVQRDGDKVRGIRIECCCGEVIELDCIY